MKKTPIIQQTFFSGAETDLNPELFELKSGKYYDAKNLRPTSAVGDRNAMEKIGGETLTYNIETALTSYIASKGLTATASGYVCIGARTVNSQIVAFWASSVSGNSTFITVDGTIVCYSSDLPLTYNHPLQMDINESCAGGEVFITDFNVKPMIFNVQDMVDSVVDETYFDNFNLSNYTVSLEKAVDLPIFDSLTDEGVGGGLPVGYYAYSIRYVDSTGERTQFSPMTPLIPVIANVPASGADSDQYPGVKYYGAVEDATSPTNYGIKIKFRVNNVSNYQYIEVKRIYFQAGSALGYVPAPEVYQITTELLEQEISVWEFTDKDTLTWVPLTDEQDTQSLAAIKRAKAIRYMSNRLELANIEYEARDIEDQITFLQHQDTQRIAYPYMHKMGTLGHNDPYHYTYHKSFMGGERVGLAVKCYDETGENSFALPIYMAGNDVYGNALDHRNYEFPNRRDACVTDTRQLSVTWGGMVNAVTTENAVNEPTHEVFGNDGAIEKSDISTVYGIKSNVPYNPLTPKSFTDSDVDGHDCRPNIAVWDNHAVATPGGNYSYSPKIHAPDYYSRGVAIQGLSNLPDWVKGFSVVRTKPAGRVIAQGIAMFKPSATYGGALQKELNKIWFFSNDIDQGFGEITTNHQIQFVSPLGYISEAYAGLNDDISENDGIDLLTYTKILRVLNDTNTPQLQDMNNDYSYWVKFGKFRNNDADCQTVFGNPVDGNKLFDISAVSSTSWDSIGRNTYYEITLGSNAFVHQTAGLRQALNHADTKKFHEPFYIVNIVADGKDVPNNNINNYIETGHYQKVESIIGVYDPSVDEYELIDERYDDCIPSTYDSNKADVNCFVYIRDKNNNEERWLNVTEKTSGTITTIMAGLQANGYYDVVEASGTYRIYGVYWSDWGSDDKTFKIIFSPSNPTGGKDYSSYGTQYLIPSSGSKIVVRYDNRFPVKVFGGDTVIGESVCAFVDGYTLPATGSGGSQFSSYIGYPYPQILTSNAYHIYEDVTTQTSVQQVWLKMDRIRQMVLMYTSESRAAVPFIYNEASSGGVDCNTLGTYSEYQSFPMIHYVQRPHIYHAACASNFGNAGSGLVHDNYHVDFPGEFSYWAFGGFKTVPKYNLDYSEWNTQKITASKPQVGYTDQDTFCSRTLYSKERSINIQDSPNLKTFLASQYYDIEDAQGGIQYLFDANSDRGDNLYAITTHGVCLLLTGKTTLSDATGGNLGLINVGDEFIQQSIWLTKEHGMTGNTEMWRSAAEYNNQLVWANNESVYMLYNNSVRDIRLGYHNALYNSVGGLEDIASDFGTRVNAVFDRYHQEYWLHLDIQCITVDIATCDYIISSADNGECIGLNPTIDCANQYVTLPNSTLGDIHYLNNVSSKLIKIKNHNGVQITTLAAGETKSFERDSSTELWDISTLTPDYNTFVFNNDGESPSWIGRYDYDAEIFVTDGFDTYALKDLMVYKVNDLGSYTINGSAIDASITPIAAPEGFTGKEFIWIRIISDTSPDGNLEFARTIDALPEATLASSNLKDYNGYVSYIPRMTSGNRDRLQSRYMAYKIPHNTQETFVLSGVIIGYTPLKMQV